MIWRCIKISRGLKLIANLVEIGQAKFNAWRSAIKIYVVEKDKFNGKEYNSLGVADLILKV